jgi:hypothetical protein
MEKFANGVNNVSGISFIFLLPLHHPLGMMEVLKERKYRGLYRLYPIYLFSVTLFYIPFVVVFLS